MPLFALISGYFFVSSAPKTTVKVFFTQRLPQYLIPFVLWALLYYGIRLYLGTPFGYKPMIAFVTGTLWFVPATLYSWLIASVIHHHFRDRWYVHLLAIGLLFLLPRKVIWLHFWGVGFLYPFFVVGYFFRKHQERLLAYYRKHIGAITLGASLLFALLFSLFTEDSYVYSPGVSLWDTHLSLGEQVYAISFRIVIGLVGSLATISWVNLLHKHLPSKLRKQVAYLGKNSLAIYFIQELLIGYVIRNMNLQGYTVSHPYLSAVALTVVVAALSALFIMTVQRFAPSLSLYLLGSRVRKSVVS